jgi:TolB-like protein/Flp pilus assembly protein TadD
MESFFAELRRRNVLRLAATYALVAWILIEAGSVLLPTFGVPDWVFRAYVIIIFVGFAVALLFAWVFEITPDGVKLESEIDRDAQAARKSGRSNGIIIALLAIALGVSITFNITGVRNQSDAPATAMVALDSVAVLPFTSRSSDPDNQFFADGIHDDLLARLADIDSLRVISRTSVNEYRETTKNLREIGAELNVATIVEGAVQRSGDQVRITVQLINAETDEHIWAQTYDRELTANNVFHIQSEISSQITTALQAALTPDEQIRLAAIPTQSIEALSLYSAARNNLYLRRFETLQEARRQFEEAIEIDPDYAQAYAGLAETIIVTYTNHGTMDAENTFRLTRQAVDRALDIDPQLAEAHAVEGLLLYEQWKVARIDDRNLEAAQSFERAMALNPNLANTYVWFASLHESEGATQDAIYLLDKALQIDPLGRIPYINLPVNYAINGENLKAIELLLKAMEIFPDWPGPYESLTDHLISLGRFDEAIAWMVQAKTMTDDPMIERPVLGAYIEFGDSEKIVEFTAQLGPEHPIYPIGVTFNHFMNNDYQAAIATFDGAGQISEIQAQFAFPVLAMSALKLGNYEQARDYLLRANPLLASDTTVSVDRYNFRSAILLAYIERQTGRDRLASELLSQASRVIREMPRLGVAGHGISDVHILVIQGRSEAALNAFRQAIDEGFVSLMGYEYWTIDQNILLDPLRGDARFEQMRLELEEKIEIMRENVRRAGETGDWEALRARARTRLTAAVRP